ncbi:hypothetical protein Cgig2_006381 [Carnegiea gigantea]|uniref:Reverse transcriptase domain-containing protein n=1 Tax=Carnegiea gigantea TaxID=171969 RepID=A0A9Q1K5A3_9CARY|nr:hypothetical protein Cgig2_006381 [Carnegiea gigantea]
MWELSLHGQTKHMGLSDHSPISLSFPHCPKPKYSFLFCDIWTRDGQFQEKVLTCLAQAQLQHDPCNPNLQHHEEIARNHYVEINQSALSLFKQQSKADWIAYGDDCSRVFMAKIKKRKAMTNIYTIRNHLAQWVKGFEVVSEVMTAYYKTLLGTRDPCRFADDLLIFCKAKPSSLQALIDALKILTKRSGLKANLDKSQIIFGRKCDQIQQECLSITEGKKFRIIPPKGIQAGVGKRCKKSKTDLPRGGIQSESWLLMANSIGHYTPLGKDCTFVQQIWTQFQQNWGVKIHNAEMGQFIQSLSNLQMPRKRRGVIYTMVNALIYNIWMVRKKTIFKGSPFPVNRILREVKEQVIQRILHMNSHSYKYNACLDYLLYRS